MSSYPSAQPECFIQSKKGNKLYCRYWNEDNKEKATGQRRGMVFICHGFQEHCLYYTELAELLINSGFYVFAHDHFGHGQSSGERAHIPVDQFEDFVADVLEHIDQVKERLGDLPVFLLGHSMGGAISILAALARPKFFKGVVLIAPLIQMSDKKASNPVSVFLVKMMAKVFPRVPVARLDTKAISRDLEEVAKYEADPLVHHGSVQCGSAVAMHLALEKIMKNLDQVDWPVYLLHSEKDSICDVEGAKIFIEKAKSRDKTIKLFPDAFHQLHKELPDVKKETLDTIQAWLTDRA